MEARTKSSITKLVSKRNKENEFFSRADFAARLKALRGERTQSEIAKMLGIRQQNWQYLETGKYEPSLSLLVKICMTFNQPISQLLGIAQQDESARSASFIEKAEAIVECGETIKVAMATMKTRIAELKEVL